MMTTQINDLRHAFHRIVANFEQQFSLGRLSAVADFYSDDAMLLPPGSDFIRGRQAIESYWQHAVDLGIESIKIDLVELEQHGNSATEISRYTLLDGQGEIVDRGKGIMIWKFEGDAWKMHRDIWASNNA